MNRFALRLLNAPTLVLIAAIGLAIQTSFFTPTALRFFKPDVVLILVIWCSLKRGFTEGGVLTLILANIAEIHSGAPQGVLLTSYMAVYLLLRVAARALVIEGMPSYLGITAFALVLTRIGHLCALYFLRGGVSEAIGPSLRALIPAIIAELALAAWAFRKLDAFDTVTAIKPGSEHGLEDEFQVPAFSTGAGQLGGSASGSQSHLMNDR